LFLLETFKALSVVLCADVPLRNYSLTVRDRSLIRASLVEPRPALYRVDIQIVVGYVILVRFKQLVTCGIGLSDSLPVNAAGCQVSAHII